MKTIRDLLIESDAAWLVFLILVILTIYLTLAAFVGEVTPLVWGWNIPFISFCIWLTQVSHD